MVDIWFVSVLPDYFQWPSQIRPFIIFSLLIFLVFLYTQVHPFPRRRSTTPWLNSKYCWQRKCHALPCEAISDRCYHRLYYSRSYLWRLSVIFQRMNAILSCNIYKHLEVMYRCTTAESRNSNKIVNVLVLTQAGRPAKSDSLPVRGAGYEPVIN